MNSTLKFLEETEQNLKELSDMMITAHNNLAHYTATYRVEANKDQPVFPNGFASWQETHYEVVAHLTVTSDTEGTIANLRQASQGTGGLYELAEQLTNKFETLHQGREWDGDFFDTIEDWLVDLERESIFIVNQS